MLTRVERRLTSPGRAPPTWEFRLHLVLATKEIEIQQHKMQPSHSRAALALFAYTAVAKSSHGTPGWFDEGGDG